MSTGLTETKRHGICLAALDAKKDIEWKFIILGKMLYDIKMFRHYEAGWDSWETFCMELKLSQASISKLMRIYEVFVVGYKIEPEQLAAAGGWSAVAELLPLVKVAETPVSRVRELLGIAVKQTRQNLRTTIQEAKRGKPCQHKKKRLLVLEICDDGCNERWNITDTVRVVPE